MKVYFSKLFLCVIIVITHTVSVFAQGTWSTKASMPTPREEFGVIGVNDLIYALGGFNRDVGNPTTLEIYNPLSDGWSTGASIPGIVVDMGIATYNGKIYVVGGSLSDSVFWEYDPIGNSWRTQISDPNTLKPLPTPRSGLAAIVLNGKLYAIGGSTGSIPSKKVEVFDFTTKQWSNTDSLSVARTLLGAATVSGKIYAFGGYDNSNGQFFNILEEYDPLTAHWIVKATMPIGRQNFGWGVINNTIYVVGGWDTGPLSRLDVYDPSSNTWSTYSDMPTARSGLRAGVAYGKLYAIGGFNGGTSLDINQEYSPPQHHTPVIFLPGIMGSPLYNSSDEQLTEVERIWIDKDKVINNILYPHSEFLDVLQLAQDGATALDSSYHIKVSPRRNDTWTISNELGIDPDVQCPFFVGRCPYPLYIYKGLFQHLRNEGYTLDNFDDNHNQWEDLFCFTYDWRRSNAWNAQLLSDFIDSVKSWTGSGQVNLITHSMGGLVAKQCINNFGRTRIKKLIFIGTPHLGVPEAQYTSLTGHVVNALQLILNYSEVKKLAKNFPSMYELFPSSQYYQFETFNNGYSDKKELYESTLELTSIRGVQKLNYAETIEYFDTVGQSTGTNEFNSLLLANAGLFQEAISDINFNGIEVYDIAGYGASTIGQVLIIEKLSPGSPKEMRPVFNLNGDGTVPLRSAEVTNKSDSRATYYVDGFSLNPFNIIKHSDLPSSAPVLEIIDSLLREPSVTSGFADSRIKYVPPPSYGLNLIQALVASPVVLDAYDSQGNHTGPTSDSTWEANIPGSDYIPGDLRDHESNKIILLPKGDSYTFVIKSQDTSGHFDFIVDDITDGYLLKMASFDSVPIQPNTIASCSLQTITPSLNLLVDTDGNGSIDTIITPTQFTALSSDFTVNAKWNLISVPVKVADKRKTTLFPTAITDAFAYSDGYFQKDSLENGIGYWLKFSTVESLSIIGIPISAETIEVSEGWNLIGSISEPVPVSLFASDPPGLITSDFFGYEGGYIRTDTIYPGKGYWVKVNQAGQLTLSSSSQAPASTRIRIVPTSELPPPPPNETATGATLPKEFTLEQNYPNPFNPLTVIRYQLPVESKVTLRIYNVLGQEVATLVNKIQDAGFKSQDWNAEGIASGFYFYRLSATPLDGGPPFIETKKMLLLR
ncbi:MAG: T9SS type A sorting domain-containing protein [Ignavibacteriae bacterium]|nr:T9SS type A sorting domain-containing protein [Ignavibacteriota bacterium]